MKTLISLVLSVVATSALAAGSEPVTAYDPAQPLDIARVISVSDTATACAVVPATMVYVDHQGQTHRVTYQVMGDCSSSW
jgi:ferritin-like protein